MTTLTLKQPSHLLRLSDLTLLAVAMVWGTSYGVAKGALAFYPVLGFVAVRFGLTLVLLSPTLWPGQLPRPAGRPAFLAVDQDYRRLHGGLRAAGPGGRLAAGHFCL